MGALHYLIRTMQHPATCNLQLPWNYANIGQ